MLRMLAATPKSPPLFAIFYSDHRGPAAYPLFLAVGEFRRQNQDHLQLASGHDARVGIKKNAAGVQIASKSGGLDRPLLGFDRDRHPRRDALSGPAFAFDVRHENWSLP